MGMPVPVDLRRGLSTTLTVLFPVMLVTLALVLIAELNQLGVVGDIKDGKSVSYGKAEDADDFAVAMSFLNLVAVVPVIVVWAVWFRRLRLNAETFAPGQHRFSPGWAAGAWFTPVVNLWFPKQIANDIWRASSPQGPHAAPRGLLNAWWVTFLAGGIVGTWGQFMYDQAYDDMDNGVTSLAEANDLLDDMHTGLAMSVVSTLVLIVCAILAIILVRQITRMQEGRAALGPQGGPPPFGTPGAAPYGAQAQPYGGAAPYGGPQYGGQQYGAAPGTPPGPGYQAPGQQQNPYGSGPTGY
ncbi:DUF4328 domain-containing protein [Streptomyces sp. HSW2009]|uniref:DUF4328 domain-containing protein n=1 Tax=Streptomyces sp. HSW2009 TaxID=3142890 RepID=UPI0032ED182D